MTNTPSDTVTEANDIGGGDIRNGCRPLRRSRHDAARMVSLHTYVASTWHKDHQRLMSAGSTI